MWTMLVAAAVAHPVGERAATQITSVVVCADRIDVDYVAEVPHALIRAGSRGPDPLEAMATELASGLLIEVDGDRVEATLRESVAPRPSSDHTWALTQRLSAPLADGARVVSVSTANLLDADNYFAQQIRLADGHRARACGVVEPPLSWRRGEAHRRLSVTLGPRTPGWLRWLAPPSAPLDCSEARILPLGAALLDPRPDPRTWWALCGLVFLLGGAAGREPLGARAVLLLGPALALLPHPLADALGAGLILALLVVGRIRGLQASPIALAATAALAGVAPSIHAAVLLVGLAAATAALRAGPHRSIWAWIALSVVFLALRALSG